MGNPTDVPPRPPETPHQQVGRELTTLDQKTLQGIRDKEEAPKRLRENRGKLYDAWLAKKPSETKEAPEDSPAYLALKNVPGINGKEAYILLSIIIKNDKLGGMKKANEIYAGSFDGPRFNIDKFRAFFTRDFGHGQLGFYYGKSKMLKTVEKSKWEKVKNWSTKPDKVVVEATGWWAIDIDSDHDDFSGETSFLKALPKIKKELDVADEKKDGYCDSSLTREAEKAMSTVLTSLAEIARDASSEVFGKEALAWLKQQANNKWAVLDEDTVGKMGFVFGAGCGIYQYRVEKDRVYALRIPGSSIPQGKKEAGYIEIKNGKLDTKWHNIDPNDLKKDVLDNMEAVAVEKELGVYKIESGQPLTPADELAVTSGFVSEFSGLPDKVKYSDLETGYLSVVQKKLAEKLKADPKLKDRAEALARTRVEDLKKKIQDAIRKDDALKTATNIDNDPNNKDANQNVNLSFKVDSNDEVKVDFFKPGTKSKFRELADKAKDEAEGAGKVARETMGKVEKALKKVFGPLAGLIMKVFPKLGEGIKDLASGVNSKASRTAGIITGLLGITVVKGVMGADKMDQRALDATIKEGTNEHTLKKTVLSGEVTLNGKKIVIPSGKGIIPGGKFNVTAKKSNGEVKTEEVGGKPAKRGFFGFGGGGGHEEVLKDDEITIEAGTKIPKDTIIPAGAKVIKV